MKTKKLVVFLLVIFFIFISIAFSFEQKSDIIDRNYVKIDSGVMQEIEENREVSVIVILKDNYETSKNNKPLPSIDFELTSRFYSINAVSGIVNIKGIEKLLEDDDVKKVYLNREIKALLADTKNIVNATKTWSLIYNGTNLTGKHETICIIDTGVDYTHVDLGNCSSTNNINEGSCGKVIGGYDYINTDENPIDDHGHGTLVAGVISSTNDIYTGIAKDSKIIAIKSLNSAGSGTTASVINGIDWCVYNSSIFNISVISMSLGTTELFSSYCDNIDSATAIAIDAAIAKNISVIAAAGNDGNTTSLSSPACIKNATSVGWSNKDDSINSNSNRNNITDLFAPGTSVTSLQNGGGTSTASGTSMSTPHVAGAFALIHQYFKLTENRIVLPNETQKYLNDTGKRLNDSTSSGFYFSRINIFDAIKALDKSSPKIAIINPENNSIRNNATFFVNITSTETLLNVTIEINNTNLSMNGGGNKWNLNISNLKNGTFSYKIYGNDSFGNSNISESFLVNIDLIPPSFINNATNISYNGARKNDLLQFNITWEDLTSLSFFIFSWNDTGVWDNLTNGSLIGNYQRVSINKSITATRGKLIAYKFYANDSANNYNESDTYFILIQNSNPLVINISINSTDYLNRTNGTLNAFFSLSDLDNDSIVYNETKWYNNSIEILQLANLTLISAQNTTKNQNWTFSARVFDGFNWSDWKNASILIKNSQPKLGINKTNIKLSETQKVNITLSVFDLDNDSLSYTINDTKFILDGLSFIWTTNLIDSGEYKFNITLNDSTDINSIIVNVTINDARDLDNDNNPDFNDTDDDNDGILDESDFLIGNLNSVYTNIENLSIYIDNYTNFTRIFNGSLNFNFTMNNLTIINFDFNFSEGIDNVSRTILDGNSELFSVNGKRYLVTVLFVDFSKTRLKINTEDTNILNVNDSYTLSDGAIVGIESITYQDYAGGIHSATIYVSSKNSRTIDLSNLVINLTSNGSGRLSIKGLNLSTTKNKKTLYIDKINSSVNAVCVLDKEADYNEISSKCNGENEVLVNCTGLRQDGIICSSIGNRWKIENLSHTAVKELCRDGDGDKYGLGCSLGTDCNDDDSSKNTDCSSGSSSGSSGSGGGGGGGGSGAGGGGGGGSGAGGGGGSQKISGLSSQENYYSIIEAGTPIDIKINKDNIALKKNIFITKSDFNSVTFKIAHLDSVENSLSGIVYQYFSIENNKISNENISDVRLQFEVLNSWIEENQFEKSDIILKRFNILEGWQALPTNIIDVNINKTTYESSSPGFSVFAITANKIIKEIIKPIEDIKKIEFEEPEERVSFENKTLITGAAVSDVGKGNLLIAVLGSAFLLIIIIAYFFFLRNKRF